MRQFFPVNTLKGHAKGSRNGWLFVQESDLRYLVENVWGSISALSASEDLYDLELVRWERDREWSPWNCCLLTKDEASAHEKLKDLTEASSLKEKAESQTSSFNHLNFAKMQLIRKPLVWVLQLKIDRSLTSRKNEVGLRPRKLNSGMSEILRKFAMKHVASSCRRTERRSSTE